MIHRFTAAHRNLGSFFNAMEMKEVEEVFVSKENGEMGRANATYEEMSFANGVFVDQRFSLKQSYSEMLNLYRGKTVNVNFAQNPAAATDTINKYVDTRE